MPFIFKMVSFRQGCHYFLVIKGEFSLNTHLILNLITESFLLPFFTVTSNEFHAWRDYHCGQGKIMRDYVSVTGVNVCVPSCSEWLEQVTLHTPLGTRVQRGARSLERATNNASMVASSPRKERPYIRNAGHRLRSPTGRTQQGASCGWYDAREQAMVTLSFTTWCNGVSCTQTAWSRVHVQPKHDGRQQVCAGGWAFERDARSVSTCRGLKWRLPYLPL